MEWYTAMGLMLTLVWLYLEILRFVSYFTKMTNKKSCMKNAGFFIFKDILNVWYNMDDSNLK